MKKKNSTLTVHLSTFRIFYFIFIRLMDGWLLFKCPLLSAHSLDSPPVLPGIFQAGKWRLSTLTLHPLNYCYKDKNHWKWRVVDTFLIYFSCSPAAKGNHVSAFWLSVRLERIWPLVLFLRRYALPYSAMAPGMSVPKCVRDTGLLSPFARI